MRRPLRDRKAVSALPPSPASSEVPRSSRSGLVLLLSVEEAGRALGLGRSKTYELIAAGDLEVVHIGRSARVPVAAIEAFVERLRHHQPGPRPR
jgi:excisionase family DNA binding protein